MKKWSEIKQATLHKLFLDESEAQQQGYLEKFQYLANECLDIIANGVKPKIVGYEVTTTETDFTIEMPDDFLSFADMIVYRNKKPYTSFIYLDDRHLILHDEGDYKIYYNAKWSEITEDDIKDNVELDIDSSVLNCLPTYMAFQLLSQDDIVRSATLKNEFELMLARLDTNIMYQDTHYRSTGGWY